MYNLNQKTKAAIKPALQKPSSCEGCSLHQIGKGFALPEGTGAIPLLIVGESLGWNEMVQGLPFRPDAQAGSLLERVFRRLRFDRKQFIISNLCMCKPPGDALANTNYEAFAINHCMTTQLDLLVKKYRPKCILALGSLPLKYLTGFGGRKQGIEQMRGYVLPCSRYADTVVVGSYHPSFIRRGNSKLIGLLMLDVLKAVRVAKGELQEREHYLLNPQEELMHSMEGFNARKKLNYLVNPTPFDAVEFLEVIQEDQTIPISYDIETDMSYKESEDELEDFGSHISQIQFSIAKRTGIAFEYREPFISISKSILSTTNTKIGHNIYKFDNPILRSNGFEIKGQLIDTLWASHHYQPDLPLGLQQVASWFGFPFPWKHLAGVDLGFYGVADVDAPHWIYEGLQKSMRREGLWD